MSATILIAPSWPRRTGPGAPVRASHTRTVLSTDPLTMCAPSGETATLMTEPSWPRRTGPGAPVRASHTRTDRKIDVDGKSVDLDGSADVCSSDVGDNLDRSIMAAQDGPGCPRACVPHPHRLVQRPAHDLRAIGRDGDARDPILMAAQDGPGRPRTRVPHPH